jgi:hypothetical protein
VKLKDSLTRQYNAVREAWARDVEVIAGFKATRAQRIALCVVMFWLVWTWHFLVAVLFLPSMVSFCRSHKNWPLVLVLNIFLGWTPMWFVLLAYALWREHTPVVVPRIPNDAVKVRVNANVNFARKPGEIKF